MSGFPTEINAWKNDVARRLMRLRGEVDDIWRFLPMIPDPEIGMPFTGPLSPVPFVFPPFDASGGTPNTRGTPTTGGTAGACSDYADNYLVTMSGATGACAGLINRDFVVARRVGLNNCQWRYIESGGFEVLLTCDSEVVGGVAFNYPSASMSANTGLSNSFLWTHNIVGPWTFPTFGAVGACTGTTRPTAVYAERID